MSLQRSICQSIPKPLLSGIGVDGGGPALVIANLTTDNYITAAEMAAVTVSGTTVGIADAETLSINLSDGVHSVDLTATVSSNAWTSDTDADLSTFTDGDITVTVELDSDPTVTKTKVAVLDAVNDAPVISGNLNPDAIPEIAQVGSLVVALAATDPNIGDIITWSIESGNTGDAFNISDGDITVAAALDYETTPTYALVVRASDGALYDEITVNIDIANVTVTISGNASPSIPENTVAAVTIATYTSDGPGTPTWTIEVGNSGGEFDIDPDGNLITTAVGFDYETATSYPLTIRATDSVLNEYDELTVTVSITNVNEAPVIDGGQTAYDADESESVGHVVHQFTVTDPDVFDTGTWSITSGNTDDDWDIDSSTGELSIANQLNLSTTPSYSLGIRFADAGGLYHDIVCVITVTQSVITRQILTLDGQSSFMKTSTISVTSGDILEVDVILTQTGVTQYIHDTNYGDPNRFYLLINGSNLLNYYPGSTALSIDGTPIISGTDITSFLDGGIHPMQIVFDRPLSLGTFGVNGLMSNGFLNGGYTRIYTSVSGVETEWPIDSGSTVSEDATTGTGTIYFYDISTGSWEEFTLNESTSPDQWENGDQTRIIPITGVG